MFDWRLMLLCCLLFGVGFMGVRWVSTSAAKPAPVAAAEQRPQPVEAKEDSPATTTLRLRPWQRATASDQGRDGRSEPQTTAKPRKKIVWRTRGYSPAACPAGQSCARPAPPRRSRMRIRFRR